MRKNFFVRRLRTFLITVLLPGVFGSTLHGVRSTSQTNTIQLQGGAIMHDSITDSNIQLTDINYLTKPLRIRAKTRDITIGVKNQDAVIQGGQANGIETPLYLIADTGRKIVVELEKDLVFTGRDGHRLLIVFSGGGDLEFRIKGDQKLVFGPTETGQAGAHFYVNMDSIAIPTVLFRRFPLGSFGAIEQKDTAQVVVGEDSLISFLASTPIESGTALEQGLIAFDPSNTDKGRFVLRIKDTGAFVIGGHRTTQAKSPTFKTIDRTIAAGGAAEVTVLNSNSHAGAHASLLVINENKTLFDLQADPFGTGIFTGTRYGFVLTNHGILSLGDTTYLDYVGTTVNRAPTPKFPAGIAQDSTGSKLLKFRNPSAFFVDGIEDKSIAPATIKLEGNSGLYFRSGADKKGYVQESIITDDGEEFYFIVDPAQKSSGPGHIVFDIEAPLNVRGNPDNPTAINILSSAVQPVGGSVVLGKGQKLFPLRTFARDNEGRPLTYNTACFLVNSRVNLFDTVLRHDDTNHQVFSKNSPKQSEPTYIGGESAVLLKQLGLPRPRIALYNSKLHLHTSAAFVGLDITVPNLVAQEEPQANKSELVFFHNGRSRDKGTGRQLVLGTLIEGAVVNEGETSFIDTDAHLDIQQEIPQSSSTEHSLTLSVAANDATVTEGLYEDIKNQSSIHTIYLANGSNISIGTNDNNGTDADGKQFALTTMPTLRIGGDFFSFETQGGPSCLPELSGTTGKGAIFVDKNGIITIDPDRRANFSTMVVKSRNATIDLPRNRVFFDTRVGITPWRLDLSDANQLVIIDDNERLSDYTLDWMAVSRDFVVTQSAFIPYEPTAIYGLDLTESGYERAGIVTACACEPARPENLIGIPEVRGEVDQLQIKRSRIGDQAHVLINGGKVRELVFLSGFDSAEAPVGVVVLDNLGCVGLGSAGRDADSLEASVTLGINGVTLIPNGEGVVELNSNLTINNVCHVVAGPDFGKNDTEQRLTFHSSVPREIRVKSGGVLDLSSFKKPTQVLQLAGSVRLVLEQGARIILAQENDLGGVLLLSEQASMVLEADQSIAPKNFVTPADSDAWRVRLSGVGKVVLKDNAQLSIPHRAALGVETFPACSNKTAITLKLHDAATLTIGSEASRGGVFQVGNTSASTGAPQRITFNLEINGPGARFELGKGGFLGTGAGIIDNYALEPNNWAIGVLHDVELVSITVQEGVFKHCRIASGDSKEASLFAIGPARYAYSLVSEQLHSKSVQLGGGNIISIPVQARAIAPIVGTVAGDTTVSSLIDGQSVPVKVGVLGSKHILCDGSKDQAKRDLALTGSQNAFFNLIKTDSVDVMQSPKANIAQNSVGSAEISFVDRATIRRQRAEHIIGGATADRVTPLRSYALGAVHLVFDTSRKTVANLIEIQA